MSFVSYSQSFEDVMLWRALNHIKGGFYIDVGANDPELDSVTKAFYDTGWSGINIEPMASHHADLLAQRPDDINLQCAAGASQGEVELYDCGIRGWATSSADVAAQHNDSGLEVTTHRVEMQTLSQICAEYVKGEIHFLKIDVEGAEAAVIEGMDLSIYRPWILVIEAIKPDSVEAAHEAWEAHLLAADYQFAYADGLNRFYVANEHTELLDSLRSPPNVLDNFISVGQRQAERVAEQATVRLEAATHKAAIAEQRATESDQQAAAADQRAAQAAEASAAAEARTADAEQARNEAQAREAEATGRAEQADAAARAEATNAAHAAQQAAQAEGVAQQALQQFEAVIHSRSWRITRPLRWLGMLLRWLGYGSWAWLTLKPGCRPRRIARHQLLHLSSWIRRHPQVKARAVSLLRRFPALEGRIYAALSAQRQTEGSSSLVRICDTGQHDHQVASDTFAIPLPRGQRTLYVYVEHTCRCDTNTGMQRVTRNLVKNLMAQGECVRLVKWHQPSQSCILIDAEERAHLARWNGPEFSAEERKIYRKKDARHLQIAPVPAGENHWLVIPEVTHITFQPHPVTLRLLNWARRAGLKSGAVFYDAIPLRRAELESSAAAHATYMQQLLLADAVWPISEWARRELQAFWIGSEQADTRTMPEVSTLLLSGESSIAERVTETTETEQLILSVGSIDPRKNQLRLIRAFQAFRKANPAKAQDWKLLLVGNLSHELRDEVLAATGSQGGIEYRGHIDETELEGLYRRCAFTVFPSVEEGFGLPILESLWFGKPCICADFGAMAEVAEGGGCLQVDTRDTDKLEQAIQALINDDRLRHSLTEQALTRPIKHWLEYAGEVSDYIERSGQPSWQVGLVYFWVDSTVELEVNTGIQRVVRQLAASLMEQGVRLIPVRQDPDGEGFGPVSQEALQQFARWNGPAVEAWHAWTPLAEAEARSWFLMPELHLNLAADERLGLIDTCRRYNLATAVIFYDAIPWKMREVYPPWFSDAHRAYMTELNEVDLVMPISVFSRDDLVDFLGSTLARPQSLDDKIRPVVLAGEFPERARLTEGPTAHKGVIRVLCVGTVEPRKNHETLLEAFRLANEHSGVTLALTIAGGSHSIEPELAERVRAIVDATANIVWEESVDDARLYELYVQSDFTIYPSLEEGFGLPILESLWYARPCICADFGAMREVAEGGGCLMVDARSPQAMAKAIRKMAMDTALRQRLVEEATQRPFKSWSEYGAEVAGCLAASAASLAPVSAPLPLSSRDIADVLGAMRLPPRPKLSICISTYNRAAWLTSALQNWARLYPQPLTEVELLVCDNASTDSTAEAVTPYLQRSDFSYHCNPENVGMLGNLRETAHHARGEYIWILGDDDLLMPGSIERVLQAICDHPDAALVYLNYAYTREEDASNVIDFDTFLAEAPPIVPAEPDRYGAIRDICARNMNFFTAIYTLVFRRDHALKAYSLDTSGQPFSTMLTSIPTTYYVLNHMMDAPGVWIGTPQVVVNLNVSWMKYAPLWILERIPEVYELAERRGVPGSEMDQWREYTLPAVIHYFQEIYQSDPLGHSDYFDPERLVRRFKHLASFTDALPVLEKAYALAYAQGHPAARREPDKVFTSTNPAL